MPEILVYCSTCGAEIYRKPHKVVTHNYCNRYCFTHSKINNQHLKTKQNVACHFCGKIHKRTPFEIKSSKYNYCSRECFRLAQKDKREFFYKSVRHCEYSIIEWCAICNKIFHKKRKDSKYCSVKCQHIGLLKGKEVKCSNCGITFWRPPSQQKKYVYCSTECMHSHFVKEKHPSYLSDRNKIKNKKHANRFSIEMRNWRDRVYERDNYTCKICGARSKKGASVVLNAHHIKKFSDHEELRHDINNGITVCVACHKGMYMQEKQYEIFCLGAIAC